MNAQTALFLGLFLLGALSQIALCMLQTLMAGLLLRSLLSFRQQPVRAVAAFILWAGLWAVLLAEVAVSVAFLVAR
jgi:hypothetical protein